MLVEAVHQYQEKHTRPRTEERPLADYISYFDRNWDLEGLSKDWYNIHDVGFSIQGQMNLLDQGYPVSVWADQTARDLEGFALEYLKQGVVFPFEYQIQGGELVDKRYGGRRLLDTVKKEERGGAVYGSLSEIQKYLLQNQDEIAIMVSPLGDSGLKTDDGRKITYHDTQIYFFQRQEDKIVGTTLRTDFDLEKSKELIRILTGRQLPESASATDCVRAIATLPPSDKLNKVEDLVNILENIQPQYAYKDKSWDVMRGNIQRRTKLYDFGETSRKIIADFKSYVSSQQLSRHEYQKAVAATFLRVSKYFLEDKINSNAEISEIVHFTYGQIMQKVRMLPGCAGGEDSVTSVESITERSAFTSSEILCCTCPFCNKEVEAVISGGRITCPKCNESAPWNKSRLN